VFKETFKDKSKIILSFRLNAKIALARFVRNASGWSVRLQAPPLSTAALQRPPEGQHAIHWLGFKNLRESRLQQIKVAGSLCHWYALF